MIIEGSDFVHPKEGMRTLLTFNCFFPYGLEGNNNLIILIIILICWALCFMVVGRTKSYNDATLFALILEFLANELASKFSHDER